MKERDVDIESTEDVQEEEVVPMSGHDTKLALAMRVIASMKEQLENLEHVLSGRAESDNAERYLAHRASSEEGTTGFSDRVIDGVFDGEHMIGEDGRKYLVPPNYASKSKLVEGDLLRLNVSDSGKFIFR